VYSEKTGSNTVVECTRYPNNHSGANLGITLAEKGCESFPTLVMCLSSSVVAIGAKAGAEFQLL